MKNQTKTIFCPIEKFKVNKCKRYSKQRNLDLFKILNHQIEQNSRKLAVDSFLIGENFQNRRSVSVIFCKHAFDANFHIFHPSAHQLWLVIKIFLFNISEEQT